ncbi:hypothetical protein BaRGS_00030459, partial [Batillaria attramentaria]
MNHTFDFDQTGRFSFRLTNQYLDILTQSEEAFLNQFSAAVTAGSVQLRRADGHVSNSVTD